MNLKLVVSNKELELPLFETRVIDKINLVVKLSDYIHAMKGVIEHPKTPVKLLNKVSIESSMVVEHIRDVIKGLKEDLEVYMYRCDTEDYDPLAYIYTMKTEFDGIKV